MKTIRLLALALASSMLNGAALAADQPPATPSPMLGMFQVLLGLIVVLGAMAGVLWLMKRTGIGPAHSSGAVKIVGGVSVGNRERVLVIEVADQWIVVGVGQGRVNALGSMPRQEQAVQAAASQPANQFAAWLKQKIDKRNAPQ